MRTTFSRPLVPCLLGVLVVTFPEPGRAEPPARTSQQRVPAGSDAPVESSAGEASPNVDTGAAKASAESAAAPQSGNGDAEAPGQPVESPSPGLRKAPGQPQLVSFGFHDAQWSEVLREFAQWAELTLDLTDTPDGTFSYYDQRTFTVTEALDMLNRYLLPRGYVLLRRDKFLVSVSLGNDMLDNLVPTTVVSELEGVGENELVRVIIPLEGFDTDDAAEQVARVLGPHGKADPLPISESLVVQGFGRNLREVLDMLSGAVAPLTEDKLVFRAFPLKNLPADEAERQLRSLFGLQGGTTNVSRARYDLERYSSRSRSRSRGGDDDNRPQPPPPLLTNLAANMRVSAMSQTNSLLVTATPTGIALVEEMLKTLESEVGERSENRRWDPSDTEPVLRVYYIEEADEEEVAKTLSVVFPGVVVNEDRRHDSIHIMATPAEHREVEQLIRTLDGGGVGRDLQVIPLTRFEPVAMAALLEKLFHNVDRDERPVIQAEPHTNTLIVRGAAHHVEQIRQTLRSYGEYGEQSGTEQAVNGRSPGRFRRVPVGARNAEDIAHAVRRLLDQDEDFGAQIRVVLPSETLSQDDGRNEPGNDTAPALDRQRTRVGGAGAFQVPVGPLPHSRGGSPSRTQPATPPHEDDQSAKSAERREPSVHIEVRGGELFLYSSDSAALEEVESAVRELVQALPQRTEWTVFYLRAADAKETATQLLSLIPQSSSIGTLEAGGLQLISPQPSDFVPAGLQIVPDTRTNALFVSGTPRQVADAERFLKYLDTTEVPVSARDRVPRAIPVEHANVERVAEMVRELYKDYLEDPAARRERDRRGDDRNERRSPPADSRGAAVRSPGIRLTLAADTRTNELLVSCNEQLFQEIRALVEERDQAAFDAQPSIRILSVRDATPAQVGVALDSLFPKATVRLNQSPTISGTLSRGASDRRSRR